MTRPNAMHIVRRPLPARATADRSRPRWGAVVTRIAVRAALVLAACCMVLVGMVGLGAAFGQFHVVTVEGRGARVDASPSSVAVVVPVSTLELRKGDRVIARQDDDRADALYRVTGIDSWTQDVFALDQHGKLAKLNLGPHAGRVSRVIPYVGVPFGLVAGPAQGFALLFGAAMLTSRMLRGRRSLSRRRAQGRWVTRLGIAVLATLGLLSMSAGATFSTQVAPTHATATANMELNAVSGSDTPGNRLTLGATTLAPGDRIQRALDLTVSSDTTAGTMTGMTLTVSASPSSVLNTDATDGFKIFVQECRTSGGASGWTESGTTPAYSYNTCTKGAGGTWSDLLNTSPTNDPTAVPSANTCASSTGGTNSYRSLSELSSAYTLKNLPTLSANTTLHLVITICFPTAAINSGGGSFANAASTLTFSFDGVQRVGANK